MKENKYDDDVFFYKYAKMDRSAYGLEAAGEWPEFEKILPDFNGKRVLDLGCGYGWHCRYAAKHNAKTIVGADISEKMLEKAKLMTKENSIHYINKAMEDLTFAENSFDVVISSLAFHYIELYDEIIRKIFNWLCKNGKLIFSIEHPVFTSQEVQDWIYDANNKILHWPVDNYFYEGIRNTVFLEEPVTKYHRTLTTYLNTLLKEGFAITDIIEPKPCKNNPKMLTMINEMRRPMMLIVGAVKK